MECLRLLSLLIENHTLEIWKRSIQLQPNVFNMKWLLNIIAVILSVVIAWQFMTHETVLHLIIFTIVVAVIYGLIRILLETIGFDINPFKDNY